MDQLKNKFASFTDNLVAAGGAGLVAGGLTFAIANNIGFREGCEIHVNEPVCKVVGGDPLHTHQEGAPHFVLGTATHTGTANILEGNDAATGTGPLSPPGPPTDATVNQVPTYQPVLGITVTPVPTYPQTIGATLTATDQAPSFVTAGPV
jgi:hypothetical protein